jgi:CubicO group peptidase (beta-lactamase class C family)
MIHRKIVLLFLAFLFFATIQAGNNYIKHPDPKKKQSVNSTDLAGINDKTLARIDSIVYSSIQEQVFPGCQVVVLKNGVPVYDKCFGHYTYEASPTVTDSTLYDLASLSKTTGTLLAIMKLYDEGKLKLTDKASKYLDFLKGTDKENITITDLLFHETGLPGSLSFHLLVMQKKDAIVTTVTKENPIHFIPLNSKTHKYREDLVSKIPSEEFPIQVSDSFYLHYSTHKAAMQMIANTPLGKKTFLYSCINFVLLKEIAETISGMSMDDFLEKVFYSPMNLKNTAYLPLQTHSKEAIAPTLKKDYLRGGIIQGFVHDPAAAFLGGISGNAGLFSTATEVATIYQMLLNNGELNGIRYLSEETCRIFTTTTSASGRRALGFDKPYPENPRLNPCCISAPREVYGHTGYTGTCCWVDPVNKLVYVFLSNRTYPDDGVNKLARNGVRPKIQEVIYEAMKK